MTTQNKSNKIINSLKDNGFDYLFENTPNNHNFLLHIIKNDISRLKIKKDSFILLWEKYFNIKPSSIQIEEGINYLKNFKNNLNIRFLKSLPYINNSKDEIFILEKDKYLTQEYWKSFIIYYQNSSICYKDTRKKDFLLKENIEFLDLIDNIFLKENKEQSIIRKKKLYILFFLYLIRINVCLLPVSFIFSKSKIFEQTTRKDVLVFFQKDHFFLGKNNYSHLIDNELKSNSKAKLNFYLRFSCLIKNNNKTIKNLSDNDMEVILSNLDKVGKSKKMITDYENSIRRCLFWHGAIDLSNSRKETKENDTSPIKILNDYIVKSEHKLLINSFVRYFHKEKNNTKSIRLTNIIIDLLDYLVEIFEEITIKNLKSFFQTYIERNTLTSKFIKYMEEIELAITLQQEVQLIVFTSLGNEPYFNNVFHRNNILTLYKMPKPRNAARRAFKKEILEAMKYICVFDPPKDNYYIKTNFKNNSSSWSFFDRVEPQLPIMLFLHLCMPWRKEHIISLDRNNFLVKDEFDSVVALQLSTDKNQKKDFYIEREIFEYALDSKFFNNNQLDIFQLLNETIEHSKQSFKNLKSLERKNNEVWGKITPILCGKDGKGFITNGIYDGYYYKVLIKALIYLKYTYQEIFYYIELSKSGNEKYKNIEIDLMNEINSLTSSEFNKSFNSKFYSPHSLRKSNITHFLLEGKTLEFIIKISGHSAISTVLHSYIDFSFLQKINLSEEVINKIEETFNLSSSTREHSKDIISIFKNHHIIDIEEIKDKLKEHNLFESILTISSDSKSIKRNQSEKKEILSPLFWEHMSEGICTGAFNCPKNLYRRCSLCPYFYSGPKYFSELNSKIMQLSTKLVKYFNIIQKYTIEENLNINEAIIYEEESELDLAELQGYIAIISKFNNNIYQIIKNNSTKEIIHNIEKSNEISFINIEHTSFYSAQLEVYKTSKKNMSLNLDIEFSISELYKKILELILKGEIDNNIYLETIESPTKTIDLFINYLKIESKNINKINLLD